MQGIVILATILSIFFTPVECLALITGKAGEGTGSLSICVGVLVCLIILLQAHPAFGNSTCQRIAEIKLAKGGDINEYRLQGDIIVRHGEGNLVAVRIDGNCLVHGVEHGVDDAQFFQLVTLVGSNFQGDSLTLGSLVLVGCQCTMLIFANGDEELLHLSTCRSIDDLVDIGGYAVDIVEEQLVGTFVQRSINRGLQPLVLLCGVKQYGFLSTIH